MINNGKEKGFLNTLILDKHPMTTWGYEIVLKQHLSFVNYKMAIQRHHNCREAYNEINTTESPFNLIILEVDIPGYFEKSILNGEDLGRYIRKKWPTSKIVVATTIADTSRLLSIKSSLQPNGFLIKGDLTPTCFVNAIHNVMQEQKFYSQSALPLKSESCMLEDFVSQYDRLILFYLSKGEKTRNLTAYLPLSISSIERRKRKLRNRFGASCDYELLQEARKWGLI